MRSKRKAKTPEARAEGATRSVSQSKKALNPQSRTSYSEQVPFNRENCTSRAAASTPFLGDSFTAQSKITHSRSSTGGVKKRNAASPDKRSGHKHRRARWVAAFVVAVVAVMVVFFVWERWFHYDDQSDFQGQWVIDNTTHSISVDSQHIALKSDVAYRYTLDSFSKSITFSFGSLSGQGRYRFLNGHRTLIIWEEGNNSWISSLLSDIAWQWDGTMCFVQGKTQQTPSPSDKVTVLVRSTGATK